MSSLFYCCPVCQTQIPPLSIPGPQGAASAPGTNGTNGQNAATTTTDQFTSPGDLTTAFTLAVASSLTFVVGMDIIAGQGPGAALGSPGPWSGVITAIPSPNNITVKNLRTVDQTVTVSSGALVVPIGFLPSVPLTIAAGGTNATTKAAAQISLALGQDSLVSSGAALAQAITAASLQVGAIDVQLPAALAGTGALQLRGFVSIDMAAVTFAAAPRTITLTIRNITQALNIVSGVFHTQNTAAGSFPTHFLIVPPFKYTAGIAGDHLQMFILVDAAATGGTLTVDAGSLEAIPLRLS
jgi:hypothetical protein